MYEMKGIIIGVNLSIITASTKLARRYLEEPTPTWVGSQLFAPFLSNDLLPYV